MTPRVLVAKLPLRGGGGEPIHFRRTVASHGLAALPPARLDEDCGSYARALRISGRVVEIALREEDGHVVVESATRLGKRDAASASDAVARMFRFGDDLSPFYARIAGDERLSWAASGAGRLLASPTVFEDVVKTVCTTNTVWAATVKMATALVALGGGAFPEPELLAKARDGWYRDVAKMGYRGPYVKAIARDVASGKLDLERLLPAAGLDDDEVETELLALPGVGPYAAAHVMQLLGRHRHLILDSWTRPTYLRLAGKKKAADKTIRRAFAGYGEHAGLAFWLYLTRGWLPEPEG